LIEALRIIKLGFPTRCPYTRVHAGFGEILRRKPVPNLNLRDFAEAIMRVLGNPKEKLSKDQYQLGLTMVFFRPGKQGYLTDILDKKASDVKEEEVKAIRKFLIKKRWVRARGTSRAWIRTGKYVHEMRFQKAALGMLAIYRVFGRALTNARLTVDGKKMAEQERKNRSDMEYQNALRAKKDLEVASAAKTKLEQELAKAKAENDAKLEKLTKDVARIQEALAAQQSNNQTLAGQNSDLKSKLSNEQLVAADLRKQQQDWQSSKERMEVEIEKQLSTIEDLRRAMGSGKDDYEKQITDKERIIAELRERLRATEENLRSTKESLSAQLEETKQRLERTQTEGREEQARLEEMVRERDAQISRLQSELVLLKTTTEQRLKDQEATIEEQKKELKNSREKSTKTIGDKDIELDKTKQEIAILVGRLEAIERSKADLEKSSKEKEAAIEQKLNEQREQSAREAKRLEGKIADANRDLAIAKDQVESARKELAGSQGVTLEKLAALERALKEKELECDELREELARTKAKLDQVQQDSDRRIAALTDELAKSRDQVREQQTRFDRESWEKTNDLAAARNELAVWKDKAQSEKEKSEAAAKAAMDQLARERELQSQAVAKLTGELTAKSDDLREIKADYKAEKREWRTKQDKYEKTVAELEAQIDTFKDKSLFTQSSPEDVERLKREAAADAETKAAKDKAKLQSTIDELRNDLKESEDYLARARAERAKTTQDADSQSAGWREQEQKYKEDIARLKTEIDAMERSFISYRQSAADEVEQKLQALQGQVALLQELVDDLKADKLEAKEREHALNEQLKDALARGGEARTALKSLQGSHNTEKEKLRLALETAQEKALLEQQHSRQLHDSSERKLLEQDALLNDLKLELADALEREAKAQDALRDHEGQTKDDLRKAGFRTAQLEEERAEWIKAKTEYERKLGDAEQRRFAAQAALSELEHKRAMSDPSKAEVGVLKAQLAALEKAMQAQQRSHERHLQLKEDEWKSDKASVEDEYKRALLQKDEEAKAKAQAYKYKLQYLELSQKDLRTERKRWVDKEREFEKALVTLTAELRELRAEHQASLDVQDAFKAHTEAKDAARSADVNNFDLKKQSLSAEHTLTLKQQNLAKDARIAQLEKELSKMRAERDDALAEIDALSEGLEEKRAKRLYEDEFEPAVESKASAAKLKTMFASEPNYESDPNVSASGMPLESPVKSDAPKSFPQQQASGDIQVAPAQETPVEDEAAQIAREEAELAAQEAALLAQQES